MSLEQRTRNYEILIRFNEDGTLGAHLQSIEEILKDGAIINATPLAPVPLAFVEGEDMTVLNSVLGEATAAALAGNMQLQLQVAALSEQLSSVTEQLA